MTKAKSYEASTIKRTRSTKVELEARRAAIFKIVEQMQPMSVRAVFYQASVAGIVEKTDHGPGNGYSRVQYDLVAMRRSGRMPYGWITDGTRWQRRPRTFDGVEEALRETARLYRKALWADAESYCEIWIEKDALAGTILPITSAYDVGLMIARGYASLSFLWEAAEFIAELDVPVFIYHLGDFDSSGVNAAEKIEESLREFAPDADISFRRLAVTREQIEAWNLPTRPTKKTDTRSKGFGDISVELDAIRPDMLRDVVETAILDHLPRDQFAILKAAESSERKLINRLVGMVTWDDE